MTTLPLEIWTDILLQCSRRDYYSLSLTCRHIYTSSLIIRNKYINNQIVVVSDDIDDDRAMRTAKRNVKLRSMIIYGNYIKDTILQNKPSYINIINLPKTTDHYIAMYGEAGCIVSVINNGNSYTYIFGSDHYGFGGYMWGVSTMYNNGFAILSCFYPIRVDYWVLKKKLMALEHLNIRCSTWYFRKTQLLYINYENIWRSALFNTKLSVLTRPMRLIRQCIYYIPMISILYCIIKYKN